MKRNVFFRFLCLLLCLLTALPVLAEEEKAGEAALTGREIPIDETVMPRVNERFYLSDTEYSDPSLHITVDAGRRAYDTDYAVAYIRIANATQIRRAMVSKNGSAEKNGARFADEVHAVLAVNGDSFYRFASEYGKYAVCQGVRKKKNANGHLDVLLIDDKGDFTILVAPDKKEIEAMDMNIVNAFTFGPGLVINGVKTENIPAGSIGGGKPAQRLAIVQTGSLTYMAIVCAGPDNPGSTGMTINQFADIVYTEGKAVAGDYPFNAYNLDGGSSATLAFRGKKVNTFGMTKSRSVADILYFASAYTGE